MQGNGGSETGGEVYGARGIILYTDVGDVLQYVDEVIIGAPYSVTEDVLNKEYKVHVVAHGNTATEPDLDGSDAYEVWQHKEIYARLRIFGK